MRRYAPDGKAEKDLHYGHPQHHPELTSPHEQDWIWNGNNGTLSKNAHDPTPGYWDFSADDFLLPPLTGDNTTVKGFADGLPPVGAGIINIFGD